MTRVTTAGKWLGFLLMLAALGVALAQAADQMRPIPRGTAEQFWSGMMAVPVAPGAERYAVQPRLAEPYIYNANPMGTFSIHGQRLRQVSEAEVLALFPQVLDRLIADPSGLSVEQIGALVGQEKTDRAAGLSELEATRVEVGRSVERLRAFLGASYDAMLDRRVAAKYAAYPHLGAVLEAAELGARVDRAQRYWVNIVFEAVFLTGVLLVFWLPILSRRARRWTPLLWGSLPLLLPLPYFLGYCRAALTYTDPTFWGGALYPWVLQPFRAFAGNLSGWEAAVLKVTSIVLEPLNQPSMVWLERPPFSQRPVGPLGPAGVGAAAGMAVFAVQRLIRWRRTQKGSGCPANPR